MNPKKAATLNIVVSLILVAAFIVADYLLEGTSHNQTAKFALIAGWWIPFSFFGNSFIGAKRCNFEE